MLRAVLKLMRWSGLPIRDALTLCRDMRHYDATKSLYKVTNLSAFSQCSFSQENCHRPNGVEGRIKRALC
jgi:hypothetical protein